MPGPRGRRPATGGRPRVVYGITVPQSAATLLRGQLGWFRTQGWDVHLVTSPGGPLDAVVDRERVTVHRLPMARETRPLADLVALVRWVVLLRRLRPDVLNVGTPKAGLLGTLAGWLARVPVRVYVMRGLRLQGARSRGQRAVLWAAERLSVGLATDVVCVSHSLREEATALRLFGRRDRPVVLAAGSSNGVDPGRWDPGFSAADRDAVRAGWGAAPGDLVVGFVGRVAFDKGVQDLLAAFGPLTDLPVRLLLLGPVEDEELRGAITALGERVTRIEDWTFDLDHVYVGIDVLCLPTRREGFPNVVLEAALAEVPSITTTATGARDSVVPGVTGWLVETGDVDGLATAIRACVADREGVRVAGRAARARALSDFRPTTIWSGLEQLYRSGSPTPPGSRSASRNG
ncbi:glycosyltransferase family 4 protein [Modestobacter italicus]|uniref:glycosyltransferase family 4 protein n=1 Tax=Modestobacter italicus (strain DSM 44449 / CECT 9708 / BC 501) TaxID=2732864 RepID=UPI00141308D4|nr:glycosyltransferase family 4 protein [Modestobacter marinus]